MKAKCSSSSDRLTVSDVFDEAISSFPCVRFGNIQSKEDPIQKDFYCALETSLADKAVCMLSYASADLYYAANLIFERYNVNPNYVAYIVNGTEHTFMETDYVYTASPEGPSSSGEPMLYEWVDNFVSGDAADVTTVCSDTAKDATDENVEYCDTSLIGKVLSPASTCTFV